MPSSKDEVNNSDYCNIIIKKNVTHMCVCVLSCVQLFAAPWTVAHQAPISMEFSRQEYWSGLPFPTLGDCPYSRSSSHFEPSSLASPALEGGFFTTSATWEASIQRVTYYLYF